jgi:hypothetical protein
MGAPQRIVELVEQFSRNFDSYKSGRYNEAQVRREYIDPFFTELGWDVENRRGYAEAYKDVIHEDAIRIGTAVKAPDYCFRIGGVRKFFLEAKKPSINLKDEPSAAYQLRRYAWSAKLPLSILTDFEEFAVYDCRSKPHPSDKASTARVMYFHYTDYPQRWEEIAEVFSREAVLKGSFDRYAESSKRKKGTAEVDEAFLAEIEQWREELARNLALRNPSLSERELNYAVQKTIDRIIFLRICEDRGIERYGQLLELVNGERTYERLLGLFRRADDRYNSGLFHFTQEKERAEKPDTLTPTLVIDDKVLKGILKGLYYPDSPYEFSVLPAEILGQVYEQFLGKVITLTGGHRARIEEKPEVKKAGGVYYTPSYIVDYIVQNTVGRLVEGKTPEQVSKLRILDPACGSGSFLLGAYQYLLDWHLKYYTEHEPEKWLTKKNPPICEVQYAAGSQESGAFSKDGKSDWIPACAGMTKNTLSEMTGVEAEAGHFSSREGQRKVGRHGLKSGGTNRAYKLTVGERKRILLNNLYGVDIDAQAVEVTKLSLLLKVLEGEKDLALFHRERALPDLGHNIQCGNSLIGTDFYKGQQGMLFDEEQRYKINAFDWEEAFPEVFSGKNPGFDAVIGNPPWGADIDDVTHYIVQKYPQSTKSYRDSFKLFIEKAINITNQRGYSAFIVPSAMMFQPRYLDVRQLLRKYKIIYLWNIGDKVFGSKVNAPCCIYIIKKEKPDCRWTVSILDTANKKSSYLRKEKDKQPLYRKILQSIYKETVGETFVTFYRKLKDNETELQNLLDCKDCGIKHQRIGVGMEQKGKTDLAERLYYTGPQQEKDDKKFLIGSDLISSGWYIELNNERYFRSNYKDILKANEIVYFNENIFNLPEKIVWRQTSDRIRATLLGPYWFANTLQAGVLKDNSYNIRYLLGLMNSKYLNYIYVETVKELGRVFPQVKLNKIRALPIRIIDFSNSPERAQHDRMVELVERMLELNKRLQAVKTPDEKARLERQITATDREIDELVYELYGLTEEEKRMVEEAMR